MVYCLTIILLFQEAVMAYIKERGNNNYFVRVRKPARRVRSLLTRLMPRNRSHRKIVQNISVFC